MISEVYWDYLLRQLSNDIRERAEVIRWLTSFNSVLDTDEEFNESRELNNNKEEIHEDNKTEQPVHK